MSYAKQLVKSKTFRKGLGSTLKQDVLKLKDDELHEENCVFKGLEKK
jgi:hypothetical protein